MRDVVYIETEEEYATRKKELERKSLESAARKFAAAHNVEMDSFRFLKILEEEIDREAEYRYGLREDGLCATAYPGSYAGVKQWNEMQDDSQGRTCQLREIVSFVAKHCPLLWMEYQESKRKEGN